MIAVHKRKLRRGFGRLLLADALKQSLAAADHIGIKAVVLDVIEDGGPEVAERRHAFYRAMGFQPFPSSPTRLFIGIDTVRAARD
jgi:GNAT superfamily N-acetyltransferase